MDAPAIEQLSHAEAADESLREAALKWLRGGGINWCGAGKFVYRVLEETVGEREFQKLLSDVRQPFQDRMELHLLY